MNSNKLFSYFSLLLLGISVFAIACEKDAAPDAEEVTPTTPVATNASFTEQFDTVGNLTAKGWVFKNNSAPIGQSGWRQGRYEATPVPIYKGLGSIPFIGFPAFTATISPNEFVSCDVTAVADDFTNGGTISSWLISPSVPMRNGDKIIFYTRAVADQQYPVYTKDRMQVWINSNDGTANVGTGATSTGSFTSKLLDINEIYDYNDPGGTASGLPGYPQEWTKYTVTVSGIGGAGSVSSARFAFRYFGVDAGVSGGTTADNFPTVVGIDSLAYVHTN